MSNTKRGGIHKPLSRLTLEDLFGPGPGPSPDEIRAVARNETRKRGRGRDTSQDPNRAARLEAIKAAAEATATSPEWTRAWHPTARVFILEIRHCSCGRRHESPGADGWLVEYTNKNTGVTHTYSPVGPIDYRLPIKQITHETEVAICQFCYTRQERQAPQAQAATSTTQPEGTNS